MILLVTPYPRSALGRKLEARGYKVRQIVLSKFSQGGLVGISATVFEVNKASLYSHKQESAYLANLCQAQGPLILVIRTELAREYLNSITSALRKGYQVAKSDTEALRMLHDIDPSALIVKRAG